MDKDVEKVRVSFPCELHAWNYRKCVSEYLIYRTLHCYIIFVLPEKAGTK